MLALNPTQLANASHSIGILDQAGIPYALAIGNHDYDKLPPVNRSAITFNQYFGPSRYANAGHYGATNFPAGSNENFYETFNWGGKSYLVLVLEFVPRNSALAWAKSVLNANTDKEVIVVTHSYLYSDGTTVDECDTGDMIGDNYGGLQWSNFVSQFPNISVVLSGHITNKFNARRSDVGVGGNFVHQIFANWQDWTNGGNGYLRTMQFSPSNNTIKVKSYSPYTGLFLTDAGDQFTLKWHNDGAPGSGTATVVGRVRNAAYGKGCSAIAGATVNVGGATVTTDSNGRFSLTIPPSQVTANATAGYLTSAQNVKLNDYFTNELDFFLTPTPPCPQSSVDPSVTICTPAANSTVTSPVNIVAGTNDSGSIVVNMFVWVDGIKQWTASGGSLNVSLPMASGLRRVSMQGKDAAGRYFRSVEYITVQ